MVKKLKVLTWVTAFTMGSVGLITGITGGFEIWDRFFVQETVSDIVPNSNGNNYSKRDSAYNALLAREIPASQAGWVQIFFKKDAEAARLLKLVGVEISTETFCERVDTYDPSFDDWKSFLALTSVPVITKCDGHSLLDIWVSRHRCRSPYLTGHDQSWGNGIGGSYFGRTKGQQWKLCKNGDDFYEGIDFLIQEGLRAPNAKNLSRQYSGLTTNLNNNFPKYNRNTTLVNFCLGKERYIKFEDLNWQISRPVSRSVRHEQPINRKTCGALVGYNSKILSDVEIYAKYLNKILKKVNR
ncbi:MAG: hypothetical protein JKY25_12185 [Robiginitomaculum sp.]|nr:hypothetical protein [Robiginitomaculum sp.]